LSKTAIITCWIISLFGSATWIYGFLVTGHPPIIDWHTKAPSWIAEFLPNVESEVGMLLSLVGIVPMYWGEKQP
jgi:hypothetical protein